jgi:hypothetical protein
VTAGILKIGRFYGIDVLVTGLMQTVFATMHILLRTAEI